MTDNGDLSPTLIEILKSHHDFSHLVFMRLLPVKVLIDDQMLDTLQGKKRLDLGIGGVFALFDGREFAK